MLAEKFQPTAIIQVDNLISLSRAQSFAKRTASLTLASVILLAVLPFMVTLAALIQLDGQGPALARQTVRAQNGRTFQLYGFRPSRTPLDELIRSRNLHLLPQLVNVIKGDMNLG